MLRYVPSFLSLFLIFTSSAFAQVYKATDDLISIYQRDAHRNAYFIQQTGFAEYRGFVERDMNSPERNPYYTADVNKPTTLSGPIAEMVLKAADTNPVLELHLNDKYNPDDNALGFCFGRAMFVDLYLRINGLNRGSIKKAFIIGPMSNRNDTKWNWHVTTIVQSKDPKGHKIWLAIDPVLGKVMEVMAWYKEFLKMPVDYRLRLFIADANKFGPESFYNENSITHKAHHKYFTEMKEWFSTHDASRDLKL